MARGKQGTGNGASKPKAKKGGRRKRSQAEDMTEAKANEVESGPVLDLQPIEIDEKDFDLHYKSIKAATDKKETAMSVLRTCKKRAKEASPDILAAVEKAMKFERADPADVKKELQIAGFALQKTNSPIQLTLHNTLLGDINDIAYKRGFADGEAGRTANSTYPPGSEPDKSYMRGWRHGAGKNLGQTPEQVDAALAEEGSGPPEPMWNDDPPHLTKPDVGAEAAA